MVLRKQYHKKKMISDIDRVVSTYIDSFCEEVGKEHGITKDVLTKKWEEVVKKSSVPSHVSAEKKKTGKKSMYQNFFIHKRIELKKTDPSLNFGDLSKQISKLWKEMSKEDQKKYAVEEEDDGYEIQPLKNEEKLTFDGLNKKKMSELRQICEERGLRRTGNKNELIKNILGMKTIELQIPKQNPVIEENEDVEVIVTKDMKRSDIEEDDNSTVSEDEFDFSGSDISIIAEDDD